MATKTTSKVANAKIVRFIKHPPGVRLGGVSNHHLAIPLFDLSRQETAHIRVDANLACVSPAPAATVQVGCRNRQIPLGFSIILIRRRKAMGRQEKVPLQGAIVESAP
jgi:hypothetical protein